jgi:hypothetical protein
MDEKECAVYALADMEWQRQPCVASSESEP